MINPEIKNQIIKDLANLPINLQKKVKDYTHKLLILHPKGMPGKNLSKFSGIIDDTSAKEMRNAISEDCERIDHNEW